ncbi:MAG: hypothetical protein P8J30_09360 [Ilumatobacter sp.]|nr:hypothetical protein [Ilumatobacter sp.]
MSLRVKALLVGVAALLAVIWALRAQQERSSLQWLAEQRLADERSAFAPTDVVEMGPMPPELRESSGLGASRTYPGVFWTHNDSGDEPRLYALDADAALLATIEVIGADARDWEAMTLGRCPTVSDRSCLYVADMGDNRSVRESVALYIVEEPDPFGGDAEVPLVGTVPFVYPDGPHDAEGLAITAVGDVIVVTKEREEAARLFEIPAVDIQTAISTEGMLTLGASLQLPIGPDPRAGRIATGAALSAAGDVLAVRTYSEIYRFRWPIGDAPEQIAEACFLGTDEPQGEALAFRADTDDWFVLTSETHTDQAGFLQAVRCGGVN